MYSYKNISLKTIGWSLLFILALYFPTLHYIDHLPIRWWDESLFGLRALYMHKTGDYLSNFQLYDGLMDHRNTKLPFTTWIQVLFIKVLGIKVLALRLPIVFIFYAMVAYTLRFCKKHLSATIIGVIFTLILICSPGIVRDHLLRTGDQDLPFLCYLFVMVVSYFQYLESKNKRHLIVFSISISAALLTKNLLAGAFLPGLLLYTLYSKKLQWVLKTKEVWWAIISVCSIFFGVIIYLNSAYPGFVDRMWGYELLGRYTDAKDGHRGGLSFFVNDLAFVSFKFYFWWVPLSLLVLFSKKLPVFNRKLLIYLGIIYFSYLGIISFAETKLFWYGTPIIPIGALMISMALHHVYSTYVMKKKAIVKYSIVFLTALIFFVLPYRKTIDYVFTDEVMHDEEHIGAFMKRVSIDHPNLKTYTIANKNFGTAAMWYKEQYNIENNYNVSYRDSIDFQDNEVVITCLYDVTPKILEKYEIETIQNWNTCQLIKIIKQK